MHRPPACASSSSRAASAPRPGLRSGRTSLMSSVHEILAATTTDTEPMSEPILLTPGPLPTSVATKTAMLTDWGSWDGAFNALTASVCRDLLDIVDGQDEHVCVPLQGSGTFAVEAALGTLVPRDA